MGMEPGCANVLQGCCVAQRVRGRDGAWEQSRAVCAARADCLVLGSQTMSVLSFVIALLLSFRGVLGYLYLAKAPSTGCADACVGNDLLIGNGVQQVVFTHAEARNSSLVGTVACLPLPPQFNTWGPPYRQDEGFWSVGYQVKYTDIDYAPINTCWHTKSSSASNFTVGEEPR